MRYLYLPRPGFHINKVETQAHGEEIAKLAQELGRPPTSADYEPVCAKATGVVHDSWLRRKEFYIRSAGRRAAGYFISGIQIISVKGRVDDRPRLINIVVQGHSDAHAYTHNQSTKFNIIDELAEQYRRNLRGLALSFANVAGVERLERETARVMKEFIQMRRKPPGRVDRSREEGEGRPN